MPGARDVQTSRARPTADKKGQSPINKQVLEFAVSAVIELWLRYSVGTQEGDKPLQSGGEGC